MGNGDIVVGGKPSPRKPSSVTVTDLAARVRTEASGVPELAETERHCGAMSQQRGNSGMLSTPQKFVRLVGSRDPKARPPGSG